jgi:uncharacterized membrane protein
LFLASSVCSQDYYADVVVDLDEAGSVTISGTANHPLLAARSTDSLTSKRGAYWLFNLTLPKDDLFSDYVFELQLPQGAGVNYVKTSGKFRIATDGDRITVKGVGSNESLSVVVQYQLKEYAAPKEQSSILPYAIIGFVLGYFLLKLIKKKPKIVSDVKATRGGILVRESGLDFEGARQKTEDLGQKTLDLDALTERQKDIIKVLKDEGKPINQTLVCERLGLPKSSVSRNVDTLEKMGLIKKTRNGMSMMLSVND